MGMEQPSRQSVEQSFRESLKDVQAVVEKLSPHCTSFTDLLGMVELALTNDGQLALLMNVVAANTKR